MEAHEAIDTFRREKLDELDRRVYDHCLCTPRHRAKDVLRAVEVCAFAAGDERCRCWDSMIYLLDDLHDTIWPEHECYRRGDS